jgi:hypothetical protein
MTLPPPGQQAMLPPLLVWIQQIQKSRGQAWSHSHAQVSTTPCRSSSATSKAQDWQNSPALHGIAHNLDPQLLSTCLPPCAEAYIYVPLPTATSYGHRAELWVGSAAAALAVAAAQSKCPHLQVNAAAYVQPALILTR